MVIGKDSWNYQWFPPTPRGDNGWQVNPTAVSGDTTMPKSASRMRATPLSAWVTELPIVDHQNIEFVDIDTKRNIRTALNRTRVAGVMYSRRFVLACGFSRARGQVRLSEFQWSYLHKAAVARRIGGISGKPFMRRSALVCPWEAWPLTLTMAVRATKIAVNFMATAMQVRLWEEVLGMREGIDEWNRQVLYLSM